MVAFITKRPDPVETNLFLELFLLILIKTIDVFLMAAFLVLINFADRGLEVEVKVILEIRAEEPHETSRIMIEDKPWRLIFLNSYSVGDD